MKQSLTTLLVVSALFANVSPAAAEDGASVGIAAGLGLAAASGKTTLGDGAGGIEAALLTAEAIRQAGALIADDVPASARILVVAKTERLDLLSGWLVHQRLGALINRLQQTRCSGDLKDKATGEQFGEGQAFAGDTSTTTRMKPKPTDLVAALATDVDIGAVTVSPDDRLLINAVVRVESSPENGPWQAAAKRSLPSSGDRRFVIPGELVAKPVAPDGVVDRFVSLTALTDG